MSFSGASKFEPTESPAPHEGGEGIVRNDTAEARSDCFQVLAARKEIVVRQCCHQGQVPTCGATPDPEAIGIEIPLGRIFTIFHTLHRSALFSREAILKGRAHYP